ncbi:MAG TPA: RIP metalloprotease RseP [Acidobacteriaceae bacterium]|jgi:regulator of sigma E protease|nr:RIP metalloprotease RseP [Acidobacteriaceae bacterium]
MHLLSVLVEFGIVLGIMVLVHEFGHFAVAKLCGVRVETFSIGFGPRLFGWRRGDTDYRLSLLPLGGYVKMSGDVPGELPTGDPGEFNAHPRWQRVLIALAGPVANFILSFGLLAAVGMFHHEVEQYLNGAAVVDYVPAGTPAARAGLASGDTITQFNNHARPTWTQILEECALNLHRTLPITFTHNGIPQSANLSIDTSSKDEFTPDSMPEIGLIPRMQAVPITVMGVEARTPAARAGLQPGDQLMQIDSLQPHSVTALLSYLQDRNGAPSDVTLLRKGQPVHVTVTPERLPSGGAEVQYRIGFSPQPPPVDVEHLSPGAAVVQSARDNLDDSTLILRVLKGMFTRHVSVRSLSGPVGIAQQIDVAVQMGFWTLLRLMSTISLNLGIFNLLPIPILDGGMILFLLIEAVMRRDLNQEIKERVYQVAFVCLIVFAVFVIFNDITKLHRP